MTDPHDYFGQGSRARSPTAAVSVANFVELAWNNAGYFGVIPGYWGSVENLLEMAKPLMLQRVFVERVTGIEPALSAWEADVLPLNYTRRCRAPPIMAHAVRSGGR